MNKAAEEGGKRTAEPMFAWHRVNLGDGVAIFEVYACGAPRYEGHICDVNTEERAAKLVHILNAAYLFHGRLQTEA